EVRHTLREFLDGHVGFLVVVRDRLLARYARDIPPDVLLGIRPRSRGLVPAGRANPDAAACPAPGRLDAYNADSIAHAVLACIQRTSVYAGARAGYRSTLGAAAAPATAATEQSHLRLARYWYLCACRVFPWSGRGHAQLGVLETGTGRAAAAVACLSLSL